MNSIDNISRNVGRRYFPAMGHRDFRFLWTAILLSDSGTWALVTVRAVMAREIADEHGDLWVGITVFAGMIPFILVPPIAGYLADRFVRKHVLAFTFVLAWAQCIALTVLAFTGALELWHLVALSFVNGSARAVQTPTAFSLVPNLVPRDLMINAFALNSATFHASRLVGPGLIAPLLATVEPGWVFAACNVPFVLSLLLVFGLRTVSTGAMEASKGFISNLIAGFKYVYQRPALTMIVLLITFHCGLTMSFEALLPVLSDERFGWGGSGGGVSDDGCRGGGNGFVNLPGRDSDGEVSGQVASDCRSAEFCGPPGSRNCSKYGHRHVGGKRDGGYADSLHGDHPDDDAVHGPGCGKGPDIEHLHNPRRWNNVLRQFGQRRFGGTH